MGVAGMIKDDEPTALLVVPINAPMPLVNSKEDREAAIALIDSRIREKATKAVIAAQRYAEVAAGGGDDMTEEERRIAGDAAMSDREVPFGLKLNLRVFESFRRSSEESERPSLAIQINFGGSPREYPVIKVEGNK